MPEQFFTIDHQGLNFRLAVSLRRRNRPWLILLHGLGCSRHTFDDIWNCPAFEDYAILAPDLPGFGDSDHPQTSFSYDIQEQARLCAVLIRQLAPRRFHIIGHSMGGAIGLLLPSVLLAEADSFISLEGNLISADCSLLSRQISEISFDQFRQTLLPRFQKDLKQEAAGRFFLEKTSVPGFYQSAQSLVRWSDSGKLLERFKNLKCPKAYFYGEANAGLQVLQELDDIPRIKIPASGHFMMNDNPTGFYEKLHQALTASQVHYS